MRYLGASPLASHASYIAAVDAEACNGCAICSEQCSAEAITVERDLASLDRQRCLGCGVYAHLCPAGAIRLQHTDRRMVIVPPPRLAGRRWFSVTLPRRKELNSPNVMALFLFKEGPRWQRKKPASRKSAEITSIAAKSIHGARTSHFPSPGSGRFIILRESCID